MINKVEMNNENSPLRLTQKHQLSGQGKHYNYLSAVDRLNFKSDNQAEEQKKNKFSFKKTTNLLGVLAWLSVIGLGIYKVGFLRPKSAENIAKKAETQAKIIGAKLNKVKNEKEELNKLLEGKSGTNKFFTKSFYKIGSWAKGMEDKLGSELYNNLTYAFGTLVVMPLVIWTSPFGKKDSSTSDKAYATLRQPFSVAATFGMQFTFDKMFDKYLPKIIAKNTMESDEVKKGTENGKIKSSLFDKIKYNYNEVKRIFKENLVSMDVKDGGLKGIITQEQANEILTMPNKLKDDKLEIVREHHNLLLKGLKDKTSLNAEELADFNSRFKSFEKINLKPEQYEILEKKMKTISNTCGLNNILKQRPKVFNNVIFSSIIGCTFLNVIYGKSMKAIEKVRGKKNAERSSAKEVK